MRSRRRKFYKLRGYCSKGRNDKRTGKKDKKAVNDKYKNSVFSPQDKGKDGVVPGSFAGKALCAVLYIALAAEIVFFSVITYTRLERLIYPLGYSSVVSRYSEEYSVPAILVYATIKTESNFRPDARSAAGALGLMQLMPDTFDEMAVRCDDSLTDDYFNTELNIKYGTAYLSYLYSRFGRWDYTILAYNAGPENLISWITEDNINDNGEILNIPFKESREYLEKVNRAMIKYEKIYKTEIK